MSMDAFLMSSGVPQSSSQAPTRGRFERQTALFRVFVFEAEDGDINCVKEDERSLLSLMVKASKGDVSSMILISSQAIVPLRWILLGLDHWITLKFGEVVC